MSQNTQETDNGPEWGDDQARSAYVSAFGRGLAVIRCFSQSQPTLTIAEVARAAGLNRATARRFLHTLETDGYASCENGRYRLRPTILELGYSYLSTMSVDSVFQFQLHDLAEKLHESCSAGVLDGHDVVFVARAQTSFPRIMTLALSVGTRIPAYLTAIGRVLLAELTDNELDEYLRTTTLRRETDRTITDPGRLREVIQTVRNQGHCIMDQEIEAGICAVSVPVRQANRPTMGISVAAHASRTSIETIEREYLPALRATGAEIERILRLRN
ncbi:IclR family transcriptional regulator domain-containing protein [Acrocarpospora catenulata]|uniref:IclR family transcriptional regulator domain-containing protein n=1 Tax=Acrocarpospora catenulata TaxID=2836182 RepID=UPI001BD9AB11|nr:IclR family transcriptional regulator C-terminal domain-containing protein [Acrocarpospora catenulata]